MLSQIIKNQIIEKLKPINPEKIILFGSFAYGKPHNNSDLDIFVIEKSYKSKIKEKLKIKKLLNDIDMPIDILVESVDFFESHSGEEWINTAWYDAKHYGEVLYEKR